MKFRAAVNLYVEDQWSQGRFTSERTEKSYRHALQVHGEDVQERDPRTVNREDVKRTLRRYRHPNTQRRNRSMLVAFYDWMVEEGYRKDNPARQTARPKARKPQVYRLTIEETRRFLASAETYRECVVAYLGVCAGLRREELRLLQGRHLARDGWVWVSSDIAKGSKERWVPVLPDLIPLIAEIRDRCALDHYVLPGQQFADPGTNRLPVDRPMVPGDGKTIWRICMRIGARAGVPARVHPHMMRHAFADHVARHAGLRQAQAMLGHSDVSTTQTYLGQLSLDELQESVAGISFGVGNPPGESAENPQQWRRWESNPRTRDIGLQSGSDGVDAWLTGVLGFAEERGRFYSETLT